MSQARRRGPKQRDASKNIFTGWSVLSVIGFWLVVLLFLASVIFISVPFGLSLLAMTYVLPKLWRDPRDESRPDRQSMIVGTFPYKVATFMNVMDDKKFRSHIFSPIVMFGFGPPEDDIQKNLHASYFKPPTRVAAYMALFFAIAFSFIEHFIYGIQFPIWGAKPPEIIAQVLSGVGIFAVAQVLRTAQRYQMGTALTGVDHTPAVMFNKIPKGKEGYLGSILHMAISTVVSVSVVVFIGFIIGAVSGGTPWGAVSKIAVLVGVGFGLFSLMRSMTKTYRREFDFQIARRDKWNDIWGYKNDLTPFFEIETPIPGEPGKPGGPPLGSPVPEPHVWAATFSYPMNGQYKDYCNEAPKVSPSLPEGEMVTISPISKRDTAGQPIPGTVSDRGFRVWWMDFSVTLKELLTDRDGLTGEQREVAVRANIVDPIAEIKKIGRCLVKSHMMMTSPDSSVNIIKVTLVPPKGVTESDFTSNIATLSSTIGAKWVRAKKSDSDGRFSIDLYIGDNGPKSPGIDFPEGAASRYRNQLLRVDWEYTFTENKITSPSGAPSMILSRPVTEVSDEIVFDIPPGISLKEIIKRTESLKTTSGNQYVEIHGGVTGEKNFSRREQRELKRFITRQGSSSQFTMVAAPEHPLERVFLFSQYKDQIITGRERGIAKIDFAPGVKADGSLANFSFNKDFAHLVLAGSSGSGKSVLIYSMICQFAANNYPEDLEMWIIDPKIGFQDFQFVDSVTRYVDSWTPRSGHFFESVRDLFKDAVDEMYRRNELFRFSRNKYPDAPTIDKLGVAREFALSKGPNPDGSPNELLQPYIVIIIDEVAMLFAGAPDKETKELQAEILYYATKIARESRSAGIHCLFATQYPTTASLPSIIKQQSGRIGLQTQDGVASKVIIDQVGLEDLYIKGSGKVQEGKSYFDFRGLLLEESAFDEHSMTEIINSLPTRDPDPDRDGISPAQAGGGGDTQATFYNVPTPDDAVFSNWDNTVGAGYRDIIGKGGADKLPSMTDKFLKMSDEEFASMSLEDFKQALRGK